VLRVTPGTQDLEVNPEEQVVGTLKTTPATPGDNVVTNIDTGLQQVADNALATQILNLRKTVDPQCSPNPCLPAATGGAVIVMDPQSGAVYAMSSYPTYNPSAWVGGISTSEYAFLSNPANNEPLINRAIDGLYTPGSTFKLSTATAALDLGLITPTTPYDDKGVFMVPGCQYNSTSCTLHNAPGDGALGEINVSTALTVSDDDFFYNLGAEFYDDRSNPAYGDTPIQNQANQYSLGELTGIDLPGESNQARVDSQAERVKLHAESPTGFPNTTWFTGDNVEMAFGQGATVITPIEQAVAYSTFANGGTRYAPQVAAAIVSPSGKVVKRFTPQVTGHVSLPPATYQALLTGFEGVVSSKNGTAYGAMGGLNFPGGLAGKTGTADSEIGKEPTAWFVGFGPTADPQYVVVCVIDQAGYGATAAAPVVRSIFSYLATHPVTAPGIPPQQGVVQSNSALPLPTTPTGATTSTTAPAGTTTTIPSP
jgi:penicillin-binding protein 2